MAREWTYAQLWIAVRCLEDEQRRREEAREDRPANAARFVAPAGTYPNLLSMKLKGE